MDIELVRAMSSLQVFRRLDTFGIISYVLVQCSVVK